LSSVGQRTDRCSLSAHPEALGAGRSAMASEVDLSDEVPGGFRPEAGSGRQALKAEEVPTMPRRAPVTWRKPPRSKSPAPRFEVAPDGGCDPIHVVESLGLRSDAPRALIKAIVTAVRSVNSSDAADVVKALSAFNLASLLKPDASVASLASGIAELTRSGPWPQMVRLCK
jgi:hypothetical protein